MAKTIKAIICPVCGSNKKRELKPDYFICDSCKTEYYLDNDDITIIHKNNPDGTTVKPAVKPAVIVVIAAVVFAFLMLTFVINFFTASSGVSNGFTTAESRIDLNDEEKVIVKNKSNALFLVTIGIESTGSYDHRNEKIVVFYDDSNGKNVKKQEINMSVPKNKASSAFAKKYFSNGDTYLIFNEKVLFKVDPNLLEVRQMKEDYFNAPELVNGIAKLEGQYMDDAFKIQTLDGKSYTYLPETDQVFSADDYRKLQREIPPDAVNTTTFKFTSFSSDNTYLLVKYVQKRRTGYPNEEIYFDDKNGTVDVRFTPANFVSAERFVPDRTFFNADVIGQNDRLLVLRFTLDPNRNSSNVVQALDTKTGAVVWTFDCSTMDEHVKFWPYTAVSNQGFTMLEGNFDSLVLDNKTGKLVATIKGR